MGETAEPTPADDEVLIDVHAASVSYMNYPTATGGYQMRATLPYVPGTDAAGVVVAVGDKVARFRRGDRVACANWFGGFAERMVAKDSKSARLPEQCGFLRWLDRSPCLSHRLVRPRSSRALGSRRTALIMGAAGGVGLACVEVAHLIGGKVIAAVGSAAKAQAARYAGAEHVIDYSCEDLRERVKALTKGEGIDVGVDNIGGALFLTLARLMRWNGHLIPMGFVGGEIPSVPMNLPLLKNYSIVGVFAGAWITNFPDEGAEAAEKVLALVGEGALRPRVDRVLPLEQAAEAVRAVAERSVRGRIVLRVR